MLRRLNYTALQLRVSLFFIPFLSFSLALWILADGKPAIFPPHLPFQMAILFATVVWQVLVERYGLARTEQLFVFSAGVRKVLTVSVAFTVANVLLLFFLQVNGTAASTFVILSGVIACITAVVMRLLFRAILSNRKDVVRILVIGADTFAERTAASLAAGTVVRCEVLGFVAVPGQEVNPRLGPVFEFSELRNVGASLNADEIIIAAAPNRIPEIPVILDKVQDLCVPVRAVFDFGEGTIAKDHIFAVNGLHMLDLHRNPSESVSYVVAKRIFDLLFATVAVVATAPAMLLIAILIKLTSRGPVLFVQQRVGLNGAIFNMYKFRTMHVADRTDSDTVWTTKSDNRCTSIGRLLRKTSMDELPQFFNVLKGEMSVVGPRPERPYFVQQFLQDIRQYNTRHSLKVGITGWAQVNGWRGDTAIDKRIECDLYYLRNWSFGFDLQIVMLTLVKGFISRNAY